MLEAASKLPDGIYHLIFGAFIIYVAYLAFGKWLAFREGNKYEQTLSKCESAINRFNENMHNIHTVLQLILNK